ncbi:MAG: hypothetical protein IPK10_15770 [Bacteroidetes bacterium]|nr:hypothetical protein [Bacteroidota bacterium]
MDTDELFTKGFNFGYILAKFNPELTKKITQHSNSTSNFAKGLVWGKKEFEKEIVTSRASEIDKARANKRDIGKGRSLFEK